MDASSSHFADALISSGPAPALRDALMVYGRLVGAWRVRVVDYAPDGAEREGSGDWMFAWTLDGRAIQDVWISPPPAARPAALSQGKNRYGTSIRVYDPATDTWRITWINPPTGDHFVLIGRADGDRIIQEGVEPDGTLLRWTFLSITADAFEWVGEASSDNGRQWVVQQRMWGARFA